MTSAKASVKIITMNGPQAHQFSRDRRYGGQRNISLATVKRYYNAMLEGSFQDNSVIQIGVILARGPSSPQREYLLDGQHRLAALAMQPDTHFQKFVVVKKYFDSMTDMHQAYAVTDTGKSRTILDSLTALGITDQVAGNDSRYVMSVAAAIKLISNDFKPVNNTYAQAGRTKLAKTMEKWLPHINAVYEKYCNMPGINPMLKKALKRSSVLAVILYTYKMVPDMADEFWLAVCQNDRLSRYDPRKHLYEWLITTNMALRSQTNTKIVGQETDVNTVIHLWNCYFEKIEIRRKPTVKTLKPIRLKRKRQSINALYGME